MSHKRDDAIRWAVWKVLYSIATTVVAPAVRVKVKREVKLPRRGPLLLVSNHPSPWDPIIVPWSMRRQVHNLGTDQLLRVPYFGWMMPYFSMIPFKKGMKDPGALAEVERRVRRGDCALIFAEGDRTWTGRSNPIKPGIGRMVKRLGVPVGFIRVRTGHMEWPRWAKYPRSVPIIVEHRAMKTYDESATPEQIVEDVAHWISVDPYDVEVPPRSFGRRLAWGLPEFMWACPHCFERSSLALDDDDDDCVNCEHCGARWRVDLANWMRAEAGPVEDMHIDAAYRSIIEHFGELPICDHERFSRDGVALEGEVEVQRIHYGKVEPEMLGRGHLELFPDCLRFTDEQGTPLLLSFEPIKAVLMQVGNKLQIRTAEENFQIMPTESSTNMWKHFIDRHLDLYREQRDGGQARSA
ncbi:MAG TPA: lysophospholipid acyltransferase family protein [Enhygromyxa sp.]|nr:lysophospholipid acyltransferase family protein [Enhygromyxa sp.]